MKIGEKRAMQLKKAGVPIIRISGQFYQLLPQEERFCQLYAAGAKAKEAYEEIYGPAEYSDACAYRTLRKPHIQGRIAQILEIAGFNDLAVTREQLKVLEQDRNLNAKLKAIEMYHKLKGNFAPKKVETTQTIIKEERKKQLDQLIDVYQ